MPTVRVPGVWSPSAPVSTELNGSTLALVYLSSWGRLAVASFFGNAIAPSFPDGAHWLVSAAAGTADARLQISRIVAINGGNFPTLTCI